MVFRPPVGLPPGLNPFTSSTDFVVSRPMKNVQAVLEQTPMIGSTWQRVTNSISSDAVTNSVTLPMNTEGTFFRLLMLE